MSSGKKGVSKSIAILLALGIALTGCGRIGNLFGNDNSSSGDVAVNAPPRDNQGGESILDLLNDGDPDVTIEVNKFLWSASLDVLNFLPIQTADPFAGVIVTGFGTPPGGSRAYRATVLIRDPALDARSINVAIATRNGPASAETVRAVEDAILTRARQLRVQNLDL